jgi:hypothetical protein
MTILLMQVVPQNIEASMFAIITATITFSTDWAGDMLGGIVCDIFDVSNADMSKFEYCIVYKIIVIVLMLALIGLVPSQAEVSALSKKMQGPKQENARESSLSHEFSNFLENRESQSYLKESVPQD